MSYYGSKLTVRLAVDGFKGSGKTSLIRAYVGKAEDDHTNLDYSHSHQAIVENTKIEQQILDSNGKNTATTAWAHGIIIIFSLDNLESFKYAEEHICRVKELTMKSAPIVLVGNIKKNNRAILLEDCEKLAAKYCISYMEMSVLHDIRQVNYLFDSLTSDIMQTRGFDSKQQRTPTLIRKLFNAIGGRNKDQTSYV